MSKKMQAMNKQRAALYAKLQKTHDLHMISSKFSISHKEYCQIINDITVAITRLDYQIILQWFKDNDTSPIGV